VLGRSSAAATVERIADHSIIGVEPVNDFVLAGSVAMSCAAESKYFLSKHEKWDGGEETGLVHVEIVCIANE
jgi:hypothetical protein